MSPNQHYFAYLLRLWQTQDGDHSIWRCSLESPGTGERHGFSSLEELFDFIQTQISLVDPLQGANKGTNHR